MVRSKSSGHLSESRSNLLGPSSVGERFHPGERLSFRIIILISIVTITFIFILHPRFHSGERFHSRLLITLYPPLHMIIILHNRFHPGERFAFAERLSLGENRAGTNTSLPTSRSISQSA